MAAGKNAAVSFDDIIKASRERKKNETLAKEIFGRGGKGRRASAPVGEIKPGTGPSLASRVGVTKRPQVAANRPALRTNRKSTGNVEAEWTHDLHSLNNPTASNLSRLPHRSRKNNAARDARLATALSGSVSPALDAQLNIVGGSRSQGMSIRGLAGPYAVMAQNFAPGTTAGDIESAMLPIGGEILSCRITTSTPIVMAEIIFQSKEGADNVIATFNNQKADGRMLYLYLKTGPVTLPPGLKSARSAPEVQPVIPTGPRADVASDRSDRYNTSDKYQSRPRSRERRRSYDEEVTDGSYGFDDRMDTDDRADSRNRGRGLYSDDLVNNRNHRGGGNGGGRGDRGYGRGGREGRGRR